jgi:predicted nucleotidyltransferase
MFSYIKNRLQKISQQLKERYPDRIVFIYAFGSRARGDFSEWSDIDILIVVKDKDPQIEREIIGLIVEEEITVGLSFSPVIKDLKVFEKERDFKTPFYENIKREGILL